MFCKLVVQSSFPHSKALVPARENPKLQGVKRNGFLKEASEVPIHHLSISSQPCLALPSSAQAYCSRSPALPLCFALALTLLWNVTIPVSPPCPVPGTVFPPSSRSQSVPTLVTFFLYSLKPLNTVNALAITTHVSVSPTKLRTEYKQMPHLTRIKILGG